MALFTSNQESDSIFYDSQFCVTFFVFGPNITMFLKKNQCLDFLQLAGLGIHVCMFHYYVT